MKFLSSKKVIISVALVAVTGAGVAFYINNNKTDKNNSNSTDQTASTQSTTDTSTQNTEETKQPATESQSKTPSTPAPTPKPAGPTVTIEYVQQNTNAINISAYSNHPQAGTCTAKFTKGSSTVTSKSVSSYVNAGGKNICDFPVGVKCVDSGGGNTICTDPFIKRSEFPSAGDWQTVVIFSSGTTTATSAPKTLNII